MIGTATAASDFIARITEASGVRAALDYEALLERKQVDQPDATAVHPWDTSYLEDRLKAEKLAFDTQAVRPYSTTRSIWKTCGFAIWYGTTIWPRASVMLGGRSFVPHLSTRQHAPVNE